MRGLLNLVENGNYEILSCENQEDFFKKINVELLSENAVGPSFYAAITEREKKFPTGLQTTSYNVALNHVDSEYVKTNALYIYRLEKAIEYHQMDDPEKLLPVELIFVLLIKDHDLQVKAISEICKLWTNDEMMWKLREQSNKEDVLALLKNI